MSSPSAVAAAGLLGIALAIATMPACTAEIVRANGGEGPSSSPGAGTAPTSGGSTNGAGGAATSMPFEPAAGMLRRLTRSQFKNAVADLLGVEVDVAELDPDSWNGNFAAVGAASVATSERGVEQYQTAIEAAVAQVFASEARRAQLLGCVPSGQAGDACLRGYLAGLGERAWRRPLESAEVERLLAVASTSASELGSATEGARWATVALLSSLSFLYRAELGRPAATGALRFTGHEMASRLSFLLWNSLPDGQLLEAASAGELGSHEGVLVAAERLLEAPAGRQAVGEFAEQYLRLDRVLTQAKDAALYPGYGPALQQAMARDMRGVWEAVALDDRSSALELFSTAKVVVNADLAKLYGLDATGLDGATFKPLSLPADSPRIGILSKAGFLSQFANQKEGSPTLRGKFIRDALMCKPIPPPPGDVTAMLEDPPAGAATTKRQRLELHRKSPTCAGCHGLMDPLGLPLETFDAIGSYRTAEQGLPIDSSGDLDGVPVANARELGLALSKNQDVADCLVSRYYSYAQGHEAREVDVSVIDALRASFKGSGYQLRQLILDTVAHEAFASAAPQP